MLKKTGRSLPDTFMVLRGRTLSGPHHEYRLFKHEVPLECDWCSDVEVWGDLGYQGMQSDDQGDLMAMPHKQPRQSTQNPEPAWTAEPRAANKALSPVRLFNEQAIGGMKRCTILVQSFRNRKADFADDAIGSCAGLWNLTLCY
jgi:DDE superfamily endonuclease